MPSLRAALFAAALLLSGCHPGGAASDASAVTEIDPIKIELVDAKIVRPAYHTDPPGRRHDLPVKRFLVLCLRIKSTSPNKRVEYNGWNYTGNVRAADEHGNEYRGLSLEKWQWADFGKSKVAPELNTQLAAHNLTFDPGQAWGEPVAVEAPVPQAKRVVVSLPAENFGLRGTFRLVVPMPVEDLTSGK